MKDEQKNPGEDQWKEEAEEEVEEMEKEGRRGRIEKEDR